MGALRTMQQSGRLEGVVVLYSKAEGRVVEYLCEMGLLYVLIGKADQLAGQTICIDKDNLLAGREATDYLYGLGHRKIAYLGCDDMFFYSAERKSGHQLFMLQHGLPVAPEYCVEVKDLSAGESPALRELLCQPDRPMAVVVGDDILAVTLEQSCIQMGLSVPGDLAMISFNNSPFAQFTPFQLTSVDVNSFQPVFEAASQLINHVENPDLWAANDRGCKNFP